ncbi:MAG: hypothetical protein P8X48_10445 [Acidiferrobacteraceae bacterium]|jgi:hypothetical protein
MPYFVYEITTDRKLSFIEVFDKFPDAKKLCREKREQGKVTPGSTIRLVFAKNQKEAEGLLKERRKPSSPVEEWEV